MNNIALPIELTPLHWLIAYATTAIYVLLKIQSAKTDNPNYKFGDYLRKHWASTLATALMLPVILLIAAQDLPNILPINNVTAALAGWQTNSLFKTVMGAAGKKFLKKENETSTQTDENTV